MINKRFSSEREFYHQILLEKIKLINDAYQASHLYLEARADQIINNYLNQSDIVGLGLSKIWRKSTIQQKQLQKVIVVTVMGEEALFQIEKSLHLFQSLYILNLTILSNDIKASIKVSPLRKKLKGFIQINLNFISFIDQVYTSHLSSHQDQPQDISFTQSLTSYLLSFPKFYQYQLHTYKKQDQCIETSKQIKRILQQKTKILESHKSQQYNQKSSPRVKVIILPRHVDQMSPLIYSYHYGPVFYQVMQNSTQSQKIDSKSLLFNSLFSLDIQQARQLLKEINNEKQQQKNILQKLANQKVQVNYNKLQSYEFDKTKQAINQFYDQSKTPTEILLRITGYEQIQQFCTRRAATTALQQTIANMINENGQKMRAGTIVDSIVKWASIPLEQFKPSELDYTKILILSYMVNSFWFFHRRIINACIQEENRQKIVKICKRLQGRFKPLMEKQQGQQRYDLYRHRPYLAKLILDWLQGKNNQFELEQINKTISNRQSKVVFVIPGPLGYGQLAMILREIKLKQRSFSVSIFCEKLVKTNEYLELMMKKYQK